MLEVTRVLLLLPTEFAALDALLSVRSIFAVVSRSVNEEIGTRRFSRER